jgi:hypothetical protein
VCQHCGTLKNSRFAPDIGLDAQAHLFEGVAMERMRVKVESVSIQDSLAVAHVVVVSSRKITGRPVAKIAIEITLRVSGGEPETSVRNRARTVALDFLDVG